MTDQPKPAITPCPRTGEKCIPAAHCGECERISLADQPTTTGQVAEAIERLKNRYSYIANSETPLYVHPDEAQEMTADLALIEAHIARLTERLAARIAICENLNRLVDKAESDLSAERLAHEQTKAELAAVHRSRCMSCDESSYDDELSVERDRAEKAERERDRLKEELAALRKSTREKGE